MKGQKTFQISFVPNHNFSNGETRNPQAFQYVRKIYTTRPRPLQNLQAEGIFNAIEIEHFEILTADPDIITQAKLSILKFPKTQDPHYHSRQIEHFEI